MKLRISNLKSQIAFTLIELLVVVTIIVILLALLVPAMDKAIYRAELLQCAARLHGIATGVQIYAVGYKRTYPVHDPDDDGVQPANLKTPVGFDYRPTILQYTTLAAMQCPLTDEMDLADDTSQWIWTNYDIRAGFGYRGNAAMRKLGDRWNFTDTSTDPANPRPYRFDIVVGDVDTHTDKDRSSAAHADRGDDAKMSLQKYKDPLYYYHLWVTGNDGVLRGKVDLNWAYQDGSAATLFDIKPLDDERMARVPCWASGQDYDINYFRQVPKP